MGLLVRPLLPSRVLLRVTEQQPGSERPRSDWSRRAEQARQDGSWYADREQYVPLSTPERRRRFFTWAVPWFVVGFAVRLGLELIRHHADAWSPGSLVEDALAPFFAAVLAGSFAAWPTRRRRYRRNSDRER